MNGQIAGDLHKHDCSTHGVGKYCFHRVSWTAVFVGALVGIGLSFILHVFNLAIGLSIFTVTDSGPTLAIGGLLGMLIGILVSMFVAGFVAGMLGRPYCSSSCFGVLYGFTTWCLILLFTVSFSMHMGRYATAYSGHISNPVAVVVTDDSSAPAVSAATHPAKPGTVMVVNQEKAAANLAVASFVVFFFIFLGALASCFGGYCGMSCCNKERYSE